MRKGKSDVPVTEGGFVRFRKRQWGYQGSNSSVITTATNPATRVIPWRGVPEVNLNYTYPDQDEGSLHRIAAPYQTANDITANPSGALNHNDVPYLFSAGLIGGITPTGATAKSWGFQPPSLTMSPLGKFTEEYGDDVTTDWWQLIGGSAESFTLTGDGSMGPLEASVNMRWAQWKSTGSTDHPVTGTVPTAALTVDATPVPVFLGDCELFLNATSGAIGTTKISDALEGMVLTVTNGLDVKRRANGSNTRFAANDLALGSQEITLALTLAKNAQTVGLLSENDLWFDDTPATRFAELRFTNPTIITGVIPYSLSIKLPFFYTTRGDGEQNNNTQITLTGTGVYNASLGYAINATVVNTLSSL